MSTLGPAVGPTRVVAPDVQEDARAALNPRWRTIVHDDPVNTMDYVTWVFQSYFGFSLSEARSRMMRVHTTGRAVVSTGVREHMEIDVTAMHSYGLRATLEPFGDDDDSQGES